MDVFEYDFSSTSAFFGFLKKCNDIQIIKTKDNIKLINTTNNNKKIIAVVFDNLNCA